MTLPLQFQCTIKNTNRITYSLYSQNQDYNFQIGNWLDQFALQEGFNYKIRNSETDEGIVRRINYVCAKSGTYNPKITAEPTKRWNSTSQHTLNTVLNKQVKESAS